MNKRSNILFQIITWSLHAVSEHRGKDIYLITSELQDIDCPSLTL
jgi:hypothetical protein